MESMAARAGQKTNRIDSLTGSTIPAGQDRAGSVRGRDLDQGRKEDSLVHVAAVALRRFAVAVRAAASASAALGASRICQTTRIRTRAPLSHHIHNETCTERCVREIREVLLDAG
jgi:hypothetical protein